jgi:hypothetical protein
MTTLGTSGGATATNPGALTTNRRFGDFHLQLKYRASATSNNGGVIVRGGDQVAILDNGTAGTRSGAIVGLAPTSTAQAKPVREWNTLDVIAYGNRVTSRLNGVEVASHTGTRPTDGPIALENAGNNLMYADIKLKELAPDTTAPTITIRSFPDTIRVGTPVTPDYDCADEQDLVECSATPIDTSTPGKYTFRVTAKDAAGNVTTETRAYSVVAFTDTPGSAQATVPATLSLTLGTPATFGTFVPGLAKEYTAGTTATVTSTAGDASLIASEPGHLANGPHVLPQALRVEIAPNAWSGPVSNATSTITFKQLIGVTDPLRTGTYSKTVTFTLSTTNP